LNSYKIKKRFYILAILDNRIGNRNQIFAILNELNLPYKILDIKYNWLANLPNFLLQIFGGFSHIKNFDIKKIKTKPSLILSCGRRTFPLASKLKSLLSDTTYFIHLMYPKLSLNIRECSLIFTPFHDNIETSDRVIKTLGSPSPLEVIKIKKKPSKTKPIISILIGGNHGRYKLKPNTIDYMIKEILNKIKQGSILISTSRRTPDNIIKLIDKWGKQNKVFKIIFHPKNNSEVNPLKEMIAYADEFVVTGDSVSMVSQLCQYKKPVRIIFNKEFCATKHINFCTKLIDEGYAYPFESLLEKCDNIKTLNTTKKISKKILSIIKQ
jgi:mitochondrial fission protein ELM1